MVLPKWDLDEAEAIPWLAPEAAYSLVEGMKKAYGFSFTRNACFFQDGRMKWYTLTEELVDIGNKCLAKFKIASFRRTLQKKYTLLFKKCSQAINDYKRINKQKLSATELLTWLEMFTLLYRENFNYGFFIEPFDFVLPDIFQKTIAKYHLSPEELNDLLALADTTYLNRETQELLEIAIKYTDGKKVENKLELHREKYEWLGTGHAGKKVLPLDFFKKRMLELVKEHPDLHSELQRLQHRQSEVLARKKELIQKYHFDKEMLILVHISDEIGPLHDLRKELFVKSIYYADDVREHLGLKTGYTLPELQLFELKELMILKEGKKLNPEEIRRRQEFYMLDVDTTKKMFVIRSGKEAMKYTQEFAVNYGDAHELSGMTASPGKIRGMVKIVFGLKDFSKINTGDILVTGMTRPEMMPVIKKAGAIITDEGGLLCHAAIVAREFKIPCIIGTQIATKILKDGDFVEINTDTGTVTLLRKK